MDTICEVGGEAEFKTFFENPAGKELVDKNDPVDHRLTDFSKNPERPPGAHVRPINLNPTNDPGGGLADIANLYPGTAPTNSDAKKYSTAAKVGFGFAGLGGLAAAMGGGLLVWKIYLKRSSGQPIKTGKRIKIKK